MKKPNYVVLFVLVLIFVYLFIVISAKANVLIETKQHAEIDLIEKLDLDKDGQITIKEAVAAPAVLAVFGRIDSNRDGKISRFELSETIAFSAEHIKSTKLE